MASTEGATAKKCLDESLTNIQWLCELESSELLLAKKGSRETEVTAPPVNAPPHSPNPYTRPPYSYATLILLAINSTEEKRMTLQEIYKWIEERFPYYTKCKKAWKNSIRHNLSLHSFFLKEKRPADLPGKGSYWSISPEGKENIMREVIKHAQPLVQTPYGAGGQGLRPILPKPSENTVSTTVPAASEPMPKLTGICSLTSGGAMMPVVVLPTNVYMSLAAKIASGNVKGSLTPLGSACSTTHTETHNSSQKNRGVQHQNDTSDSNNMNDLMNEILNNANFNKVLDSFESDNTDDDGTTCDGNNNSELDAPNNHIASIKTPTRKNQNNDENIHPLEPEQKKKKGEHFLFPKPSFPKKSTPVHRPSRSPLRKRNQPTLAAVNDMCMPLDKDFKFQELSQLMLSPVCIPNKANNGACSKISTPTSSSPLTYSSLRSGLTPLKYDSDSGFFTPLKDSDFEYLLSPNQLDFALTPAKSSVATPQKCRKSLRLGTVTEEENENDPMAWMNI